MNTLVEAIAARADEQAERIATIPDTINGAQLGPRQREVLALMMEGHTGREIAVALIVAPETVRSHVRNLLENTHARNRVQLAVWAAMGRTGYSDQHSIRVAS
jgi:DNA-binding NarL/FixJ family response regulator